MGEGSSPIPDTMSQHLLDALAGTISIPGTAKLANLQRLTGGANMETWSFDIESESGREALILRRLPRGACEDKPGPGKLAIVDEATLLGLAGRSGVPVPVVRYVLNPEDGLGSGYVMSRERGEALPYRLLRDERYRLAREGLAFQCGEALGRIHRVSINSLPAGLPDYSGALLFDWAQQSLDDYGNVSPVLQLGLNWLRDNARPVRRALVHGDFRSGNLLVDERGLVAVLDWELAHLGDPVQDLGYISANVWRFGERPPVGGFGEYADLLAGYEAVTGEAPPMEDIHYWQVHAALSWGMVCLLMLQMYRSGEDASLERAAVGRRLSEAEIDLLLLLQEAS